MEGVVKATPRLFYRREWQGTNSTWGWVGPRAGVDGCEKPRPHRDSIPDRPARGQSLHGLRYPAPHRHTVSIFTNLFTRKWSTNVTKPISIKLTLASQLFIKNSNAKYHENPTSGLVTDITSQTDGLTQSPHKAFLFYVVQNAYKVQNRDDAHVQRPHHATSHRHCCT
jgi:hypothetical protein